MNYLVESVESVLSNTFSVHIKPSNIKFYIETVMCIALIIFNYLLVVNIYRLIKKNLNAPPKEIRIKKSSSGTYHLNLPKKIRLKNFLQVLTIGILLRRLKGKNLSQVLTI